MAKKTSARKKSLQQSNPDDAIRDAILRHLHQVHFNSKSPKSAAVGVRDIQSALKRSHGYKQQQVSCNLDYLVQKEWVAQVVKERSFKTRGGTTQSAEQFKYKISHIGIDMLQQASLYQRTPMSGNINVTNVNGVTVVGDGNIVNTEFGDLSRALKDAKKEMQADSEISNQDKLIVLADIDSIQSQLQKPEPNRAIVNVLWSNIQTVATAGGFVETVAKLSTLIAPLVA